MSLENSKKVVAYAVSHPSFRAAFRSGPKDAIADFSAELNLSKESITVEEMDAIISLSDDDFDSVEKLAVGLGDDFSSEAHTGGVIL